MTRAITLTEPIARAIAQDAANRQMRKRCETSGEPHVWDEDDYNLAVKTLERIWVEPNAYPVVRKDWWTMSDDNQTMKTKHLFDQLPSDSWTCRYCGETPSHDNHSNVPPPSPALDPNAQTWRYSETHGAHVAIGDKFKLRGHWNGLAGSEEVKTIMRQIVADHAAVPRLVDTLRLTQQLPTNQLTCERSLCESCQTGRQAMLEAIAFALTTTPTTAGEET